MYINVKWWWHFFYDRACASKKRLSGHSSKMDRLVRCALLVLIAPSRLTFPSLSHPPQSQLILSMTWNFVSGYICSAGFVCVLRWRRFFTVVSFCVYDLPSYASLLLFFHRELSVVTPTLQSFSKLHCCLNFLQHDQSRLSSYMSGEVACSGVFHVIHWDVLSASKLRFMHISA